MFGNTSRPAAPRRKSGKCILLMLAFVLMLSGCATEQPPAADTPEPPNHNGVFESEFGALVFNGDGESVTVRFEDEFAGEAGLPQGECQGVYVFKFHNGAYRYDKAEALEITIDGDTYTFLNDWQETNETVICLSSPIDAGERMRFERTA